MRGGEVVCVGIDVTEQRAAEVRAERAFAALDLRSTELERSNRDRERFAQLLSHDLREAVQAVSGFTELLETHAGSELDARAAGYLTAAREASAGLTGLLDGISAYSRLGNGEALASDVDCEQTLDVVLRELAGELAGRGAEVTRDPLPVVPGDPEELRTLLSQLIVNAIRGGGDRVHVGAERRGLGWHLTVSDDGDGRPRGRSPGHLPALRRARRPRPLPPHRRAPRRRHLDRRGGRRRQRLPRRPARSGGAMRLLLVEDSAHDARLVCEELAELAPVDAARRADAGRRARPPDAPSARTACCSTSSCPTPSAWRAWRRSARCAPSCRSSCSPAPRRTSSPCAPSRPARRTA